jgi:membrane associated rhomboid family serine protease
MGASSAVFATSTALTCVMPNSLVSVVAMSMPSCVFTAVVIGFSIGAIKNDWVTWMGHAGYLGGIEFGALFWAVSIRRHPMGYMP